MNTKSLARRLVRAYRSARLMGGRIHIWADGSTRWLSADARLTQPGPGYIGSLLVCGTITYAEALDWVERQASSTHSNGKAGGGY